MYVLSCVIFFFKQKTAYEMRISDWSSDVCSSDLDGSYAIGATKAETIRQVLLPAALPGIMGGVLLALSRAIGETMIVVMAAGLIAKMTINPLDSVTTVTVPIVTLMTGATQFENHHHLDPLEHESSTGGEKG